MNSFEIFKYITVRDHLSKLRSFVLYIIPFISHSQPFHTKVLYIIKSEKVPEEYS